MLSLSRISVYVCQSQFPQMASNKFNFIYNQAENDTQLHIIWIFKIKTSKEILIYIQR